MNPIPTRVPDVLEFELPNAMTLPASLSAMLAARKKGLQRLSTNEANDNPFALALRQKFHDEVKIPILAPHASQSVHNPHHNASYQGTSGYVVGIELFLEVYQMFCNCEAVQICFGLDGNLAEGAQLQLVFRGIGGVSPGSLYTTAAISPQTPLTPLNPFYPIVFPNPNDGDSNPAPGESVEIRPCEVHSPPCLQ